MDSPTVLDLLVSEGRAAGALAARSAGHVLELCELAPAHAALQPLTLREEEGRRIYERSLRFVLLLALERLFPGQQVRIEYSVGHGVYVRLPGVTLTAGDVQAIEAEMHRITAADLPFEKKTWALSEAIRYFEEKGQSDKVALLHCRPFDYFTMYCCGGMWEYFYGAMTPSTGYVRVFGLTAHEGGLILRRPTAQQPDVAVPHVDRPRHLAVFEQSARWCGILGVVNAADVTRLVREHKLRDFIRVNEALHDKAIADIAEKIVRKQRQIILIAGPSSSGKTTFSNRLAIHLRVLGKRPILIGLDDYYLDRDTLPREADGSIDLESIHTIDTALFQQHMMALMRGETVELPRFSFVQGKREPRGTPVRLEPGHPVIIEGIHGLNPLLSDRLPQEALYRVFVSALTCINLDDHNRIRTTDVRLLRRIVRDHQFRGTPPEETLAMWDSVRRGEETWIFPWQETADSIFNTALHYEIPILRHVAYPLLANVAEDAPNYLMAKRLRKMLHYFPQIDPAVMSEIPPTSLLREFVGGSSFHETKED